MDKRISECLEAEEIAPDGLYDDYQLGFLEGIKHWIGEFTDNQEDMLAKLYKRACESDY